MLRLLPSRLRPRRGRPRAAMRRGAARTPGGGKTRTLHFGGAIGALRRPQGKLPRCSGGAPGCVGALKAFGRSAEADGALSSGREEGSVHRPARLLGVRDEERLLVAEQQARRRLPRRLVMWHLWASRRIWRRRGRGCARCFKYVNHAKYPDSDLIRHTQRLQRGAVSFCMLRAARRRARRLIHANKFHKSYNRVLSCVSA